METNKTVLAFDGQNRVHAVLILPITGSVENRLFWSEILDKKWINPTILPTFPSQLFNKKGMPESINPSTPVNFSIKMFGTIFDPIISISTFVLRSFSNLHLLVVESVGELLVFF